MLFRAGFKRSTAALFRSRISLSVKRGCIFVAIPKNHFEHEKSTLRIAVRSLYFRNRLSSGGRTKYGSRAANERGTTAVYSNDLLQKIRTAAGAVPGSLPRSINYLKYAESPKRWSKLIEGGGDSTTAMARTVFQITYPDGWIMVDAGMDRQVHRFFGKDKKEPEPFDSAKSAQAHDAVLGTKPMFITHEHGDHVAGAIRMAGADSIAHKTILTTQQADALVHHPQMPEIKLDAAKRNSYIDAGFETLLPVAPGVVLIKAPGHTPGEIIVYTRLYNGREYMFTGDVSWTWRGIAERRQKPEAERKRVGEDADKIQKELDWLNSLMSSEGVMMLVSHDDVMLPEPARRGLIGNSLMVR